MAVRHVQRFGKAAPEATADAEVLKVNAAHARAMPLARMLDYGMTYADATALHRMAEAGAPWVETAEWLGDCNRERADAGKTAAARSRALLAACACYRFAKARSRATRLGASNFTAW